MTIIALNNQIHIYSLDTSSFYHEDELKIHKKLNKAYNLRNEIDKRKRKTKKNEDEKCKELSIKKLNKQYTNINKIIKAIKDRLYIKFKKNKGKIRYLNNDHINKYNIISIFESSLTRIIDIKTNTISKDLMIVQTYFFDVIEDIILDGYYYENEKYICLTASAGQIRTKKTVFIKESVWNNYKNTITCGLTIEKINSLGGVNINKYLAYLALANSATDLWNDFDITKTIVVNDFETEIDAEVDFIDDEDYSIKRQKMKIPISHTDGCGLILPSKSIKSFMTRLPWVKGLLIPFDYVQFIKEKSKELGNYCGVIKDIYNVEHDIIEEGIEIIFTKSQFKMYKYFNNWAEYVENYIEFNCEAGKCNQEEDKIGDAKINYQMLQTLTDINNEELEIICKKTNNDIKNVGNDKRTMLKILGVVESNVNKNYFQKALEIYPELLNDSYSKEILKQVKKSMVKAGKSAKVHIDGKYTFLSPDLYAFCENLFLGIKNPKGLLKNNEVYCNLFKENIDLDCLRSPHLFREHAIRKNVINEEKKKWFISKSIYTSCHDPISKILQFDVDGDKSLVCSEKTIVSVAKRNMVDILPLYYNMRKADAVIIDNKSIYKGLKTAYTGGNIGMISNDITKIWNSNDINLDVIKLLCMENNFTIDFAKTLYKPIRPKGIKQLITSYTKAKVPHFFIYAKDKEKEKVEKINNSVVNKLNKIICNPRINFNATDLGKFDYRMLMNNKELEISNEEIIKKYTELDLKKRFMNVGVLSEENQTDDMYLYKDIRNQILEVNDDINYVVDILVDYLYRYKASNYKTTLWSSFGDIIIENLKNNIKRNNTYCQGCGLIIEKGGNKTKYCDKCAKEIEKNNWAERKRKQREK